MWNIPEDHFLYPVRIELLNRWNWTGFPFIHGGFLYCVTAKHVLMDDDNRLRTSENIVLNFLCRAGEIYESRKQTVNITQLLVEWKVFYRDGLDVIVFCLGTVTFAEDQIHFNTANDPLVLNLDPLKPVIDVQALNEGLMKEIDYSFVGDDIYVYWYPSSLRASHLTGDVFNYEMPLIRKWIISAIYKEKGTFVLHCSTYFGDSWSPVIHLESNSNEIRTIWIVVRYIPYIQEWADRKNDIINYEAHNSGYSLAIPIKTVLTLLP